MNRRQSLRMLAAAFGGAMLIPPGPLDRGLDSFFAITPMPERRMPLDRFGGHVLF